MDGRARGYVGILFFSLYLLVLKKSRYFLFLYDSRGSIEDFGELFLKILLSNEWLYYLWIDRIILYSCVNIYFFFV